MPGRTRWVAVLLTLSMLTMGLALSAGADASQENEFLAKINAERSAVGLGALTMSGSLQTYARSHSTYMAEGSCPDDLTICHSSNAQLIAAVGSGWTDLGENVGRGGSVDAIHTAFMNSDGHKANILGNYTMVGIGTVVSDGTIYVTVVFVNYGSSSTPTTAPAPATTTQPKVTATATTPPTSATTTLVVPPDHVVTPGNQCIEATRFWQMCQD